VRIAIDDFGTGYSSLSYLGQLPVDVLKIDRSFTKGLDEGDDRNLVPAILELAGTLGLTTVAEGVETPEQGVRLVELGCELAQGFYFARPVPESELMEMIERPPVSVSTWARSIASRLERGAATVAAASRT
jgi:EAL domain-containing protein (putative c-di-GMP-specific phosphodiesterase class I)